MIWQLNATGIVVGGWNETQTQVGLASHKLTPKRNPLLEGCAGAFGSQALIFFGN
jgi:hypothetical protein